MINDRDFQVDTFNGPDNKMYIKIDKVCDVNDVIRLRNFLDIEINRIQAPVAEMLKNVQSNVSQS